MLQSCFLDFTNLQLLVKASRATQGRVQSVGPVRGPQNQELTGVPLLEGGREQKSRFSPVNKQICCSHVWIFWSG